MKMFGKLCRFLTVALLSCLFPPVTNAQQQDPRGSDNRGASSPAPFSQSAYRLFQNFMILPRRDASSLEHGSSTGSGGIKEEIPDKFRDRYLTWKNEFLSTETGRRQWEMFARNENFILTINISTDNRQGATTGKYKWNDAGELVGVTITLGSELDEGYPDPVYYPVMHSLSRSGVSDIISRRLLAATKIAHEFGHVNRALSMDAALYRLQNQLMPVYKRIFLNNGHNARDPRLLKLASQMGGTSVEIWEDREYWGEANAMLYLRDRIPEKNSRCILFSRIRRTVEAYAVPYAERFKQIALSESSMCGWQ